MKPTNNEPKEFLARTSPINTYFIIMAICIIYFIYAMVFMGGYNMGKFMGRFVPIAVISLIIGLIQWRFGFRNYVQTVAFEISMVLAWSLLLFLPSNSGMFGIIAIVWVSAVIITMLYSRLSYQSKIAGVIYSISVIPIISFVCTSGLLIIPYVGHSGGDGMALAYHFVLGGTLAACALIGHLISSYFLRNKLTQT